MSDTGHHAGKPPKYDGKGGQSFKMWVMKYKAWMHNIGIGAVESPGSDRTLPAKEATVLDLTQISDKAQLVALALNYKAVNECVLSFETAEMVNEVIEEQAHNKIWPGDKFTRIWK